MIEQVFSGVGAFVGTLAVVVGLFAAYYARRALFPPKRRIALFQAPAASALSSQTFSSADVSLVHQGVPLRDPFIVSISAENTGRHAIGSDDFDGDRPITIEIGAPIRAVLALTFNPPSQKTFAINSDQSQLNLGPDLLNAGHSLTVQILTDGDPSRLDLEQRLSHFLKDTKIDCRDAPPQYSSKLSRIRLSIISAAAALVATAAVAIISLPDIPDPPQILLTPADGPPGAPVKAVGVKFDANDEVKIRGLACMTAQLGDPDQSSKLPAPLSDLFNGPEIGDYSGIVLTSARTDGSGRFEANFTIPTYCGAGLLLYTAATSKGARRAGGFQVRAA